MVNYIRAELYKVFRRKYTWITLVVVLALESLLVAGWAFTNSHGNHVDFYTGAGMLCTMLSFGFYATLLTCDMVFADQYKNSTMKNEVAFGLPRSRIYLGKYLASLLVSLLFMAVMVGFYLALCYVTLYRDPERDALIMQVVGYCLATALPLWIGGLACTCAFYFNLRSDLWASIAAISLIALVPAVLQIAEAILLGSPASTVCGFLNSHWPTVMVDNAPSVVGGWAYCGQAWIVGAIWLAVFTALGISAFRKKEIQ